MVFDSDYTNGIFFYSGFEICLMDPPSPAPTISPLPTISPAPTASRLPSGIPTVTPAPSPVPTTSLPTPRPTTTFMPTLSDNCVDHTIYMYSGADLNGDYKSWSDIALYLDPLPGYFQKLTWDSVSTETACLYMGRTFKAYTCEATYLQAERDHAVSWEIRVTRTNRVVASGNGTCAEPNFRPYTHYTCPCTGDAFASFAVTPQPSPVPSPRPSAEPTTAAPSKLPIPAPTPEPSGSPLPTRPTLVPTPEPSSSPLPTGFSYTMANTAELQAAVSSWCANSATAQAAYGHISNVSERSPRLQAFTSVYVQT
jgi:hypothetical protein